MAKIVESDIISVAETVFHNAEKAKVYSVSWSVRIRGIGHREFASYGKNAMEYEYPVEKLPKAVQSFISMHDKSRGIRNGSKEMFIYQ